VQDVAVLVEPVDREAGCVLNKAHLVDDMGSI
jgi:hypothetical protein